MKDLIMKALNDAYSKFDKTIPLTKKDAKFISIADVNPSVILQFMKDNNVPNDVTFGSAFLGFSFTPILNGKQKQVII